MLGGTSQNVRKTQQKNQKTKKMLITPLTRQKAWRDVGQPLSCNAFAIARFLVFFVGTVILNKLDDDDDDDDDDEDDTANRKREGGSRT